MNRSLTTVKRIWFVRHGQAEHNVLLSQAASAPDPEAAWQAGENVRDPGLTPLGFEQARRASTDPLIRDTALGPPGSADRAELVVVSAMRRTLQTALTMCDAAAERAPDPKKAMFRVVALPDLQECNAVPCDTGRPLNELQAEFGEAVDFGELEGKADDWFVKPRLADFKQKIVFTTGAWLFFS